MVPTNTFFGKDNNLHVANCETQPCSTFAKHKSNILLQKKFEFYILSVRI